jgi:hypothetical protein
MLGNYEMEAGVKSAMRTLLWMILATSLARGCSCSGSAYLPVCHRLGVTPVLFVGTPLEIVDHQYGSRRGPWYRFSVEEVFKGFAPDLKEVMVDPDNFTTCNISFSVGKRYLIAGIRGSRQGPAKETAVVDGVLFPASTETIVYTGECWGSQEAEHAADDIAFLQQFVRSPPPARIFGSVRIHANERYWYGDHPPLSGVRIQIAGPSGVANITTGTAGDYAFPDVNPGKYIITAQAKEFTSARKSYEVDVPAHGCGVVNIGMFSEGVLGGIVVNQDGTPAVGVAVEYARANRNTSDPASYEGSVKTDRRGHFSFARVPPGSFVLGVNARRAPTSKERILPTYWPGVLSESQAQPVQLTVNQKVENLSITLGPRAARRKVSVRAEWPDGRPAPGVRLSANFRGYIAESATTGADGSTTMTVLSRLEYSLSGRLPHFKLEDGVEDLDSWVDATEEKLTAGSAPAKVRLILNRPGRIKD